jgi:hypothetical protein
MKNMIPWESGFRSPAWPQRHHLTPDLGLSRSAPALKASAIFAAVRSATARTGSWCKCA